MSRARRDPSQVAIALAGAVAVVVFIGGIAAIVNDEEEVPAAGARIHLDGTAIRLDPGGERVTLSDGDILHPGDRVDVTEGTATFELAGGGSIEGRAGRAGDDEDTSVTVGDPMELLAGDALAVGPSGLAIESAGTVVTLDPGGGEGAARIRRDLAVTTATYEGSTAVDSVGQHRAVPALRQLGVSSVGRPAAEPDPLAYDPADPWDLRYLAAAIDASRQLDTLSRSFTAQGVALTTAADFEALLPRLRSEPAFDVSFLGSNRMAGETLIGAVIAVLGGQGSFAERWSEVFAFRDQGAAWGLVVRDQDVTEDAVIDDVTDALEQLLEPQLTPEVAGPDPGAVDDPPVDDPPTGGGTPTTNPPSTTTTTAPPDDDPESPSVTLLPPLPPIDIPGLPPITIPTLPPLDTAPLPDSGGLLDGLLQPIADILGALVGPSGLLDAS